MRLTRWTWMVAMAAGIAGYSPTGARAESPAPGASAGAAAAAVHGLDANADLNGILDALHDAGANLKNFVAEVSMKEIDALAGSATTRQGTVVYQLKGEGDARMRVTFPTVIRDHKKYTDEKIEYLLDDGWLWDRDYRHLQQVKRQVLHPGQKINLLKLGEGPFPLPIGQDKADVQRLFDAEKIAAGKEDPADTLHVQLKPKASNPQFAKKFKSIDVWVSTKSGFPARIDTVETSGNKRSTNLSNVKVNDPAVGDGDFALPAIPNNWGQRTEEMTVGN